MNCPRCESADDIVRSIEHEQVGYVAAILCLSCDRQVSVIRADAGDAIDAAEALFWEGAMGSG